MVQLSVLPLTGCETLVNFNLSEHQFSYLVKAGNNTSLNHRVLKMTCQRILMFSVLKTENSPGALMLLRRLSRHFMATRHASSVPSLHTLSPCCSPHTLGFCPHRLWKQHLLKLAVTSVWSDPGAAYFFNFLAHLKELTGPF